MSTSFPDVHTDEIPVAKHVARARIPRFIRTFAVPIIIGWIAAAMHVYLRDTAQILAVVLTLWFWATPIFVPEGKFPAWAVFVLRANPLTYIVRAYREILLGHAVSLKNLGSTAIFAAAAFVCGGLIFRYMKRGFADVL